MGFFDAGRVLVLGHRGASRAAPPNTMAAFRRAAELGADGVELDVHLSADGVPVVIHDFSVGATTDGEGAVAGMTLAELQALDAGSRFDPAFAGERIPTLEQVFEELGQRLLINVELKSVSLADNGLERAVAALIERFGLLEGGRVIASSFNPFALRRMRRVNPRVPLGLLYAPDLPVWLQRTWLAPLAPHQARHPEHSMVDRRLVTWAHRRGYRVNTWTVDDPAEMRRLIGLGVNAIITNVPDVLKDIMEPSQMEPSQMEPSQMEPSQ